MSMAEITETKTDEATGREYYVYDNGGEKWKDNGYWKNPPPDARITTPEKGREMLARRYELARQRAIEGIDEAAIEAGRIPSLQAGSGDGWKAVVQHVAKTLLESKNLRGQAEAANFLGKATGYSSQDGESPENIAAAIAQLFEKFLDRMPQRDTIEGKVIE